MYSSKLGHNTEEEGEIICLLESVFNFKSSWDSMTPLNRRIQVFVLHRLFCIHVHVGTHTCVVMFTRSLLLWPHFHFLLFLLRSWLFAYEKSRSLSGFVFLISYSTFSLMIFISFTSFLCYLFEVVLPFDLTDHEFASVVWILFPFHLGIVLIWKLWFCYLIISQSIAKASLILFLFFVVVVFPVLFFL